MDGKEKTYTCTCSVHRCNEFIDPETHLKPGGRPVTQRTLRQHDLDERKSQKAQEAEEIRMQVLKQREEDLVKAVEKLELGSETVPHFETRTQDNSRINRVKRMVSAISVIADQVSGLRKDLANFPSSPSLSPEILFSRLDNIAVLIDKGVRLKVDLDLVKKRTKTPAALALHRETLIELAVYLEAAHSTQERLKEEQKHRASEAEEALSNNSYTSDHHFVPILANVAPIVQVAILMIVACSVILRLPRRGCSWLFSMTRFLIQSVVLTLYGDIGKAPVHLRLILSQFPADVRSPTAEFDLGVKSTIFAVCPSCHQTYAPSFIGSIAVYPQRCNHRKYTGGSRCGDLLVRPKTIGSHTLYIPIKTYIVFDLKDWMAALLARPGFENMMDNSWKDLGRPENAKMSSVFHGSVLQNFKGPDGKTHFGEGGEEGRYTFCMGFDFFNPLTNKQAGKKASVGLIALACLNLPIEIRYKPENMFLAAIIPGPHEPPLDRTNPYLAPIVDFFVDFWNPGIHFTKTWNCPFGRLVICALILIICDLLAANKLGCSASHNSNLFCGRCWFNKATGKGLADFDHRSWKRRTNEDWRSNAESYRDARRAMDAQHSFAASGLRWSELLRLPYFDPTRFIVVDPMHNLLLGLMKTHFIDVLGYELKEEVPLVELSVDISTNDPNNPVPTDPKLAAEVTSIIDRLQRHIDPDDVQKIEKFLANRHLGPLKYVARGISCPGWDSKPTKAGIAKKLIAWRIAKLEPKHLPPQAGSVFTAKELQELWQDMQEVVRPSWLTSVPPQIGVAGGTPKADEWRALGSTYLPIALAKLWGNPDPSNARSMRRTEFLNLTFMFLSAVNAVMSQEISTANADVFLAYMEQYRNELQRLLPDYKYTRPNYHVSLHIAEFLMMFGPVYGWWTYPFERMIGMLQCISTNYKPGQYEETIGRSWHRACSFRALFSKDNPRCPDAIRKCAQMFARLISPKIRNIVITETYSDQSDDDDDNNDNLSNGTKYLDHSTNSRPSIVPSDMYDRLKAYSELLSQYNIRSTPAQVHFLSHLTVSGIRYTIRSKHKGNSNILVVSENDEEVPVSIEHILQFPGHPDTWALVRAHKDVSVRNDPFSRFPLLRAKLYSPSLYDTLELVHSSALEIHFAEHTFDWEGQQVSAIISLSRILLVSEVGPSDLLDI